MLTKSEIRKIANKLRWEIKETEVAVKELLDFDPSEILPRVDRFASSKKLPIDHEEFLKICAEAPNPEVRFIEIAEFLFKSLKGDLDAIICRLLLADDPCFAAWAVFNAGDIGGANVKISWDWYPTEFLAAPGGKPPQDWYKGKKSFFKWSLWSGSIEKASRRKLGHEWLHMVEKIKKEVGEEGLPILLASLRSVDPRISPNELYYKFLNTLVRAKCYNPEQLLFDVAKQVGFATFQIESFREWGSETFQYPFLSKRAKGLVDALKISLRQTTIMDTDGRYWLFYALAEMLIRETHGRNKTKVFRKVAQALKKSGYKVSDGAVRREYYRKKKIVEQTKLTLNDVIKGHHLDKAIEEYLKEARTSN